MHISMIKDSTKHEAASPPPPAGPLGMVIVIVCKCHIRLLKQLLGVVATPTTGGKGDERERESRMLAPADQTTKKSVPPISGGRPSPSHFTMAAY
eukprot:scaffold1907_cov73-Skeletonema_dohrnii-CCMP3373.AAC.2